MFINRLKRNKYGITLVELMITLAILLIVVTVSYTAFSAISKSFDFATKTSNVQQNVNLAKNIIDEKIRQATYIAVISDATIPVGEWNQSFFIQTDSDGNGHIIYMKDGVESDLLADLSDGYHMSITFTKVGTSFLNVSITCSLDGEYVYNIESDVLVLGIEADKFTGTSGAKVYFRSA